MLPLKYLAIGALILSVTLHLLIAKIFIFEFPLKNQALKPTFIFLGSILKTSDTQAQNEPTNLVNLPDNYSLEKINPSSPTLFASQFTPEKPLPKGEWKEVQEKISSKSTFELPILSTEQLTIDPFLQPKSQNLNVYKPLRLQEND